MSNFILKSENFLQIKFLLKQLNCDGVSSVMSSNHWLWIVFMADCPTLFKNGQTNCLSDMQIFIWYSFEKFPFNM